MTMNSADARALLMNSETRELIKRLMPTLLEVELIRNIKSIGQITSSELSKTTGKTVHHCSTELKALYQKGYIVRVKVKSKSGGDEFIYTSNLV